MRRRQRNIWILAFFVGVHCFLFARVALAWGPAVHTYLALQVLTHLGLLSPVLRRVLEKHPNDFIYGNLSADIILGKKYIDYYYHCHNWRVGLEILDAARSDAQVAFAHGYLCHLAADVVAHNLYVPDKLVRHFGTKAAKHAYWEIRFDLRHNPQLIQKAHRIAKFFHEPNDELLETVLRDTIFSFQTNKRIFNGLLLVQKHQRVRTLLERIDENSPLIISQERADAYDALSLQSVFEVLKAMEKAHSFRADPAGHHKLDTAESLRKKMKRMTQQSNLKDREINLIISGFHETLQQTLFFPEQLPDADAIIDHALALKKP